MATKDDNLHLQIAHYENFKDHIKWPENICRQTIDHLLQTGFLEVSTLFEHAISNVGNIAITSVDGQDFEDVSDAKLVSVRTSSYGTSYSAPITNIHAKKGTLRVQVYERKQNKYYYFKIPYEYFKDIPKTSNIEIPFEMDGNPRRVLSRKPKYANWWDFEVSSFSEMSR